MARYGLTVQILEREIESLTDGNRAISVVEEQLQAAQKEVEQLTQEVADKKARLRDVQDSLALLQAGAR